MIEEARIGPLDRVLEVGVGGGAVTKNIEGLGGFYLGIDVNKNLIDRAKKTSPQLSFAVADARYLSGTIEEPVDIIVSSLGLRAMPEKMVADIFNEFNRVLSPVRPYCSIHLRPPENLSQKTLRKNCVFQARPVVGHFAIFRPFKCFSTKKFNTIFFSEKYLLK